MTELWVSSPEIWTDEYHSSYSYGDQSPGNENDTLTLPKLVAAYNSSATL